MIGILAIISAVLELATFTTTKTGDSLPAQNRGQLLKAVLKEAYRGKENTLKGRRTISRTLHVSETRIRDILEHLKTIGVLTPSGTGKSYRLAHDFEAKVQNFF